MIKPLKILVEITLENLLKVKPFFVVILVILLRFIFWIKHLRIYKLANNCQTTILALITFYLKTHR